MPDTQLILITGAAGFIGSCMVAHLNERGYSNLVLVDDFSSPEKTHNLLGKKFCLKVHRDQLFEWLQTHNSDVKLIIHLGARTDTTSQDKAVFKRLNTDYTKDLFDICKEFGIRIIYASSAATYGDGHLGYVDDVSIISQLQPLNTYAVSKNDIDKYVFMHDEMPPQVVALKFFNVYGPNEYHKGRMASVIFHAHREILKCGNVTLFKSHKEGISDGEQMRDFVYVKDVVKVIQFFIENEKVSGLFNLGTGVARSFKDLTLAVFASIQRTPHIKYIDTPASIRDNYQYFTQAEMQKLKNSGYNEPFYTLEDGVKDYVTNYLEKAAHW